MEKPVRRRWPALLIFTMIVGGGGEYQSFAQDPLLKPDCLQLALVQAIKKRLQDKNESKTFKNDPDPRVSLPRVEMRSPVTLPLIGGVGAQDPYVAFNVSNVPGGTYQFEECQVQKNFNGNSRCINLVECRVTLKGEKQPTPLTLILPNLRISTRANPEPDKPPIRVYLKKSEQFALDLCPGEVPECSGQQRSAVDGVPAAIPGSSTQDNSGVGAIYDDKG